jgi:hypothetical protein
MAKIFSSTNVFSSRQTQGGDGTIAERQGICAAISALWCMHMLEGKRDLLTKPSYERAQALQVLYRWDPTAPGDDYLNLMQRIGLKGTLQFRDSATNVALMQVSNRPGVYHLSMLGSHTVAAAIMNDKYYFYDCDENGAGGLHSFNSADEWKALVNQHYANQRFLGISAAQ